MKIKFSELANFTFFRAASGTTYMKTRDMYKQSLIEERYTWTNNNLLVTPLYDVPVFYSCKSFGFTATEYRNSAGERHRLDGPALVTSDGTSAWYKNDLYHRLDGPALIRADGSESWYVNGVECSPLERMVMQETMLTTTVKSSIINT